ncbi:MAG: phosphohistidine phosphatase SixA [Vicinamibacterales bacterium]
MQTLLLVRHAIAEERGSAWPDDDVRPLTKRGRSRMREIADRLQAMRETSDVIVSSPLTRALDTARILREQWQTEADVELINALAPGHTPAETIVAVAKAASDERIVLVGHEPHLGELAAWLIGAKQLVPFRKGGVARIDVETLSRPREGQLIWLATPKMLRNS